MMGTTVRLTASAQKAVMRHYNEFQRSPIPGVSMTMIDLTEFHVNVLINEGPFEGAIIHWVLSIPSTYPQSPPFGRIADGYDFDERHHHHVFSSMGICADFLANFAYMNQTATSGFGWTPACDFIGLMINMQAFFADPDGRTMSDSVLGAFHRMNTAFVCPHSDCDHSTQSPQPPLPTASVDSVSHEATDSHPTPIDMAEERARRELICSVSKQSLLDPMAKAMVLGYPINLQRDRYGRLHTELITELISYDEYMNALQAAYGMPRLRSATGRPYTNWLPFYINEHHYRLVESRLHTAISVCLHGDSGAAHNDFNPNKVLSVILPLMNKQVVALMNGSDHESDATIAAYCNLLRLLLRLIQNHPCIRDDIVHRIRMFQTDPTKRGKHFIPDIGEFIIVMSIGMLFRITSDTNSTTTTSSTFLFDFYKRTQRPFIEEYFSRQIRWIIRADRDALWGRNVPVAERLQRCFDACLVSNKLLVFNIEMVCTFITPHFESGMDRNWGLPPQAILDTFRQKIRLIKTKLINYRELMLALRFTHVVSNSAIMWKLLQFAVDHSRNQMYSR